MGLPVRCVYVADETKKQADDDLTSDDFDVRAEFFTRDQAQVGAMVIEELLRGETLPQAFEGLTITHAVITADMKYELGQTDRSLESKYPWRVHVFHYPDGVMSTFRRMFGNDAET
eukprot:3502485-Rhodomonas_salina.1